MRRTLLAALVAVLFSGPVVAQERSDRFPHGSLAHPDVPVLLHPHPVPGTAALVGSGALGFVAGVALGGLAGWAADRTVGYCGQYTCGARGAFWGSLAGGTVGIPTAIHLANQRRGSYGYGVLASTGLMVAGYALAAGLAASVLDPAFPVVLLTVPLVQIGTGIVVERRTGGSITVGAPSRAYHRQGGSRP